MTDEPTASSSPMSEAEHLDPQTPVPVDVSLCVEAALMTTDRPLGSARLGEILGNISGSEVTAAIASLNEIYEQTGRSFRIEKLAGGWQIVSLPAYAEVLSSLHKTRQSHKLSPAAMETLAIIAYKQPVLRAEIETIRGVASGEMIRGLMERHLVKIVGRAEDIGRPMLYGTTKAFLEVFGLAGLKDLPNARELRTPPPEAKKQPLPPEAPPEASPEVSPEVSSGGSLGGSSQVLPEVDREDSQEAVISEGVSSEIDQASVEGSVPSEENEGLASPEVSADQPVSEV